MWLKPPWIPPDLLKRSFRKSYWKIVWGFLFCFLYSVLTPFGTFKSLGCYFGTKIFSCKFYSERVEMKGRSPRIILPIPNLQTTLEYFYWRSTGQHYPIWLQSFHCSGLSGWKTTRAVMGNSFFFFNLAETKYKIIFCKVSKSDLQHLWSSDSSSEPSLRQSLFNCWAVCFGERPPRMYIPYNQMFQWFVFQSLAPAPARK